MLLFVAVQEMSCSLRTDEIDPLKSTFFKQRQSTKSPPIKHVDVGTKFTLPLSTDMTRSTMTPCRYNIELHESTSMVSTLENTIPDKIQNRRDISYSDKYIILNPIR